MILDILLKIKTIDDFYKFSSKLEKKEKGDLFEYLTYYLFKLSPILNHKLKDIWLYKDIPNNIKIKLKLPNKDKGIDLLADIDDEYYAIQCKFRQDYTKIINWNEVATFFGLAFGINNKIKNGYFVTNTYDLCEEVFNSEKVIPIYGDFFDNLPTNFFENIHNLISNKQIIKYLKKEPFPHQKNCIRTCEEYFKTKDKGYIEMACGSGKTLTSYWVDKNLNNKKTVIFVPSLLLLSQFYQDWINQSYAENININYILIGSNADIDEEVKFKSNGIFLETDANIIKKLVNKFSNDKIVIICTYQSSDKLISVSDNIKYDMIISDESHKLVGKSNKKFSLILFDENIKAAKRLFMTATPKIYIGNSDEENVISMDDEKYYGEEIFFYNTGQAIQDYKLVDYQLITILTQNKDIHNDLEKNKLLTFKNEFQEKESNYLALILIILKNLHNNTYSHLVTYHSTINRSKKFAEFLYKINNILYKDNIYVESLDGSFSMSKRKQIIRNFVGNKRAIICSARVLNEGVNIPIIDSVCFVDARFSTIDIVQCIGRGLRLYEGKKICSVIVPIIINDINDAFDNKNYGNIINILKSLNSTDNGIKEYFQLIQQGKNLTRKLITVKPYSNVETGKNIDLEKWNNELMIKIWKLIDPFENRLEELEEWILKNKKIPTYASKDIIEKSFGEFCTRIRTKYRENKLTEKTINKLENLNGWYWGKSKDEKILQMNWDKWFELLKEYTNKYQKIPGIREEYNEFKLGGWCHHQRGNYKDKKLEDSQIKKLEEIKCWYWEKEDTWDHRYNLLTEYLYNFKKYPSKGEEYKDFKLEGWCQNQKTKYKNNQLSEYKIKKLEEINSWKWGEQKDENILLMTWDKWYEILIEYIKKYDKLPTSKDTYYNFKIGSWCSDQRKNIKIINWIQIKLTN